MDTPVSLSRRELSLLREILEPLAASAYSGGYSGEHRHARDAADLLFKFDEAERRARATAHVKTTVV